MVDRVGQQLGNYRLTQLLGEGGFAEVYLGEHIHLGTQAAIKVLSAKLHSDEIDRFRDEARTIARLRHPSIVRVLDFDVEEGVPYLVMDYASNGTLRQHHPKGTRLAPATLVPYVRQVASALQYAHDHKLIHRDVKPENMLIGENGEVLLSDFGIAIVSQSSRYQGAQDSAGTLAYMAPEQIQAHPRPASDQYSLGIVIYEWLTGERPFSGSMSEVLAKQISAPPPPLRDKLPDLSPVLEQVIFTALEKDFKDRFLNIQAFAAAFEQACQAEDIASAPTRLSAPPTASAPPGISTLSAQPSISDLPTVVVQPTPVPSGWASQPPVPSGWASQPPAPAGLPPTYTPAPSFTPSAGNLPTQPTTVPSVPPGQPGYVPLGTSPRQPSPWQRRPLLAGLAAALLLLVLIGSSLGALALVGKGPFARPAGQAATATTRPTTTVGQSPTATGSTPTATPEPLGTIIEFAIPTANSGPREIITGPDGNIWFTESSGNQIGRKTLGGGITEFTVPSAGSAPLGITVGPDRNLWFTEYYGTVGRITPAGAITEFAVPGAGGGLDGITTGPDGNLWFTEQVSNRIGRITPAGAVTEFPLPIAGSSPRRIIAGPDGNLWFTEFDGNRIGRITPAGAITEFPLPASGSSPAGLTLGPDNNLWFTEYDGNRIGRITPAGAVTEFSLSTPGSNPQEITTGPDGNLWFGEDTGNRIGRITPAGAITEFPLPTPGSHPESLCTGPDKNIWFTEYNTNRIALIATGQ